MVDLDKHLILFGHGWAFLPRVPYEIGRLQSAPEDAVIVHHTEEGEGSRPMVRLGPWEGSVRLALGPGTREAEQVLEDWWDGEPATFNGWSLRTQRWTMPWPQGTSLWSTQGHVDWPFELTVPGCGGDEMLYVQAPFTRAPEVSQLLAAGMSKAGEETFRGAAGEVMGLELAYSQGGEPWRQWRYLVPLEGGAVALVTVQATVENRAAFLALGKDVAARLRAR